MKTKAIMNLKGGTAKTVTAINMAAILSRDYDKRVLLVDADSQCNLTEFMTADMPKKVPTDRGLADILRGRGGEIRPTAFPGVDLIPATDELMELDTTTVKAGQSDPMQLADFLQGAAETYDFCLIDCPPAFSASAIAALLAADDVLIPMKLDAFGLRGMANLLTQIRNMQRVNPALTVGGILPTMYYQTQQMDEAEKLLRDSGLPVFPHIRRSVKVDDMTFAQLPLIKSSPKSNACKDYRRFVRKMLEGGQNHGV
ncbi:MAG: ParA family protein [Clostridia bacterium]|nr:ParA family protein [Clostridia bacterium]